MRSKVVIENGETNIILTPENDFETDVLDKIVYKGNKFSLITTVDAKYQHGQYQDHWIQINIKETK